MRTVGVKFGWVLVWSLLLAGCSTVTQLEPLEPQLVSESLPFIQDGKTSKGEVLSRLGEPDNRYEGGRILTYTICEAIDGEGRLPRSGMRCWDIHRIRRTRTNTLILVFGPDDLVERHSLVVVK